jgi:hypothetical protein
VKQHLALTLASAFAAIVTVPGLARASDLIAVPFTGHLDQVTDTYGKLAGAGIAVGSPFHGFITYDASVSPTFNIAVGGPGQGTNAFYAALQSYHFTVETAGGSYEFGFNDGSVPAGAFVTDFNYAPNTAPDVLAAGVSGNGFTPEAAIPPESPGDATQNWGVEFRLEDASGTVFSSDTPLPTALNLANWSSHWVYFSSFYSGGSFAGTDYLIHGNIETMNGSAPAPSGDLFHWVVAAGLLVAAGCRMAGNRPGRLDPAFRSR